MKLKNEMWVTSSDYQETNQSSSNNSFVKIVEKVDKNAEDENAPVELLQTYSYVQIIFYFELRFGNSSKLLALGREREVVVQDEHSRYGEKLGITLLSTLQDGRIILPSSILYPVGIMKTSCGSILVDPKVEVEDC